MSTKPLVYLAGPITGTTYAGCTDWREYARSQIDPGLATLSPMRHKEYLSAETSVADSYEEHVMSCARGIMTRDRFDCTRAQLVLVNLLGAERVSIGTVMEIAWADAHRIPVVLVIERQNVHRHSMLMQAAGFVVGTLDEGISVAERVLLAEVSEKSLTHRCRHRLALRNGA